MLRGLARERDRELDAVRIVAGLRHDNVLALLRQSRQEDSSVTVAEGC